MFKKLTPVEVRVARARDEYVNFLQALKPGEGGAVEVAKASVARQSVKNRLIRAADVLGIEIKFIRSGSDRVIFEIVGPKAL